MARVTTSVLRIAWSTQPKNINLGIAAQIFVQAGVVLLFIVNLVCVQQVLRAAHPKLGSHKIAAIAFRLWIALLAVMVILLIAFTVIGFFTLDPIKINNTHIVQRTGAVFFAVTSFAPIVMMAVILGTASKNFLHDIRPRRYNIPFAALILGAMLLSTGAIFRGTTTFYIEPLLLPAWFQSKVCFYLFNFTIEFLVVLLYAVTRIDRCFALGVSEAAVEDTTKLTGSKRYSNRYSKGSEKTESRQSLMPSSKHSNRLSSMSRFTKRFSGATLLDDNSIVNLEKGGAESIYASSERPPTIALYHPGLEELLNPEKYFAHHSDESLWKGNNRTDLTLNSTNNDSMSNFYEKLQPPRYPGAAHRPGSEKWSVYGDDWVVEEAKQLRFTRAKSTSTIHKELVDWRDSFSNFDPDVLNDLSKL
jgi:Protein of unknown function (DUF3112)